MLSSSTDLFDADVCVLSTANLLLAVANVAFLLRLVYRPRRCFDQVLKMLADEQGDWYIEKVLGHELAKVLQHNTRDLGAAGGDSDAYSSGGDSDGRGEDGVGSGEDSDGCTENNTGSGEDSDGRREDSTGSGEDSDSEDGSGGESGDGCGKDYGDEDYDNESATDEGGYGDSCGDERNNDSHFYRGAKDAEFFAGAANMPTLWR